MKLRRHRKILDLISESEIETQEELALKLHEAGFAATQATVSRDIRELNLRKEVNGRGRSVYVPAREPSEESSRSAAGRYARVLQDAFVSMDAAQNILVIKTVSGMAMAVAAALDAIHIHEIVGCIAGDDTVMCAIRTVEDTEAVMAELHKILRK